MKTRSNAIARLRNPQHWCRRSLDPDGCAQWPGIHTTHRLYSRRSVHAGVSELTSRLRDGLIILRQSRRLYGLLAPQRDRIATDKVKSIHCEPRVLTGDSCAKRNILPELSNFCCLPGKAGGSPYGLVFGIHRVRRRAFVRLDHQLLSWLLSGTTFPALFLQPDDRNLRESLFELGRTQLAGHALHDIFRNVALAAAIAFDANLRRHIEKHSMRFVAKVVRQLYPATALVGR